MLKFRILGPVEIHAPVRPVRVRGTLRRTLLMALLANANRFIPADTLIRELWGEEYPSQADNALQAHVSKLRAKIASLESEVAKPRLVTRPSGYEFILERGDLDAEVFMAGFERARGCHDPSETVAELRSLLALWRGPVFGGQAGGGMCRKAASRYTEARLAALELLFDGELRNGNHHQVIPELCQVLARHPFQERFSQQLALALYRSGRPQDAVKALRALQRRLADELGLEPSLAMREFERAIAAGDPGLDRPSPLLAR
jgi:SARP family transcriptional regulator, regulator of embCAB operon